MATEEDYCLHTWEADQISTKKCIDLGKRTTSKHGPHTWMLSAYQKENPFTPMLIINVDKKECLTKNIITVYLAPCNARTKTNALFVADVIGVLDVCHDNDK
jgi:hypothetical protein